MKRWTAMLLLPAIVLTLAACGANGTGETTTESAQTTAAETVTTTEAAAEAQADEWSFDESTGTLSLYAQRQLEKTPYPGDPADVRAVVLSGSVEKVVSAGTDCDGLAVYPQLRKLTLGDGVQRLETGAFNGCHKTEEIRIGSGLSFIADNAFFGTEYSAGSAGCTELKRIEVSRDNPHFTAEDNVLYNKDRTELILYPTCREKTEFTIPDSVRSVRWFAFSGNETIRSLTVGKGIETFDFSLFGCNALRDLTLPDTLREIGDSAIKYCGVRSVTIPDSVTTLGIEAFLQCKDLQSIHVGKGVVLEPDAYSVWFNGPALKTITVDPQNASLCVSDGALFSKDRKTLFAFPGGSEQTAYSVPDGTQTLAYNAFVDNGRLKKIYIPASVTTINVEDLCPYDMEEGAYSYPFEVWYGGSRMQWENAIRGAGGTEGLTLYCDAEKIG